MSSNSSEDQDEEDHVLSDPAVIDPTQPFPIASNPNFNFDSFITGGQNWDSGMNFGSPGLGLFLDGVDQQNGSDNSSIIMTDKPADLEDFEAMLRICTTLQHQHRSVASGSFLEKTATLECLNSAIAASTTKPVSSHSPETASSALLPVVVYKIMDVCEILVRDATTESHFSDPPPADCFVCLQKLDLVLFQAKTFSVRSGMQECVARAQRIHDNIQSLLRQRFQHWMWQ